MSRPEPFDDGKRWLPLDAACEHTGRSLATIKRLVFKGLVEKRLVPVPGQRDQAQVLLADLDRVFGRLAQVPAIVSQPLSRVEPTIPAVLERIAAAFARPQIELLERKVCWTLKEARIVTGLTEPALRELVAREPGLVLRQGRRWWFRAGRLRSVLG